jgi:hypothetical protein
VGLILMCFFMCKALRPHIPSKADKVISSTLPTWKLKYRGMKKLHWSQSVSKWWSWVQNPGHLVPKSKFPATLPHLQPLGPRLDSKEGGKKWQDRWVGPIVHSKSSFYLEIYLHTLVEPEGQWPWSCLFTVFPSPGSHITTWTKD